MAAETMFDRFGEMLCQNSGTPTTEQMLDFLETESKATEKIESIEEAQRIKKECRELYMPLLRYMERHPHLYTAIRKRFGMKIPNIINIGCVETLINL